MQEFSALCASYWYPLYGFARHKGCSLEDASDLTQEFFAILSEGDLLAKADPEKGKLRALFLTVFSRQMATARERAGALKRGGANVVVSIDQFSAEERLVNDPVDPKETPEKWYDRQWALVVLDCCLDQLGLEMVSRGKADEFAALRPFLRLSEVGTASRAEAARALDLQPNTVGKKIRLLQERFIAILKRHVAESLANPTPEAVEEEIRCLRNAVALEG